MKIVQIPTWGTTFSDHWTLSGKISSGFYRLDIPTDIKLNRCITDFVLMKTNFLSLRSFQSKRELERRISSRITLIKNTYAHVKKNDIYYSNPCANEYLERELFIAILEKAVLIAEQTSNSNPRETLTFSFLLWRMKQILVGHNIKKPVENISFIFQEAKAFEGIGGNWNANTMHNKISRVQQLVAKSEEFGACHKPGIIGDYPKADSLKFIKKISGGCDKCKDAWKSLLGVANMDSKLMEEASKELKLEAPELSSFIENYLIKLNNMNVYDIYERIPDTLKRFTHHIVD